MCVHGRRGLGFWGTALLGLILPCVAHASWSAPDRVVPVALGLAVILVAAKIGGDVAVRFGQVAVLGELLAGVAPLAVFAVVGVGAGGADAAGVDAGVADLLASSALSTRSTIGR